MFASVFEDDAGGGAGELADGGGDQRLAGGGCGGDASGYVYRSTVDVIGLAHDVASVDPRVQRKARRARSLVTRPRACDRLLRRREDGQHTVEETVRMAPLSEYEAYEALQRMLEAKWIELAGRRS